MEDDGDPPGLYRVMIPCREHSANSAVGTRVNGV
jgi:hypothetical protein